MGRLGDTLSLDVESARSRPIELGHQNALPLTEREFSATDLQSKGRAKKQSAKR